VDTDETAARLLNELNAQKGGRVTFIPLNRLEVKVVAPSTGTARPLTEFMSYKKIYEKAFQQVNFVVV